MEARTRARVGHTWKQEREQDLAIYGSKNGLYMGARMGHMWEQEWAIYESENRSYVGVRIGYILGERKEVREVKG